MNRPLVFVPGLFGSMSNEIIPGTGGWSFGPARFVYQPFINMLEGMGYVINESLFIAFNDWRKAIDDSAREYVYREIKKAKRVCECDEVDIIGHSMGGLLCRAYVQSSYYENDVVNLIQMATPNSGSAPNFSYWTGGGLPKQYRLKFNFVRAYMDAYLTHLKKKYSEDPIKGIHENFPGLGDIVPSDSYGDYLFYKNGDIFTFKSIDTMKTQNDFLNDLNTNSAIIKDRDIILSIIAAQGEDTLNFLEIVHSDDADIWIDGRVVDFTTSEEGDGNALIRSAFSIEGDKYIVNNASHITMLQKSKPILEKILLSRS